MHSNAFPDPRTYRFPDWVAIGSYVFRSHDVIAFGTPLTVKNAMEAYSKGIFPWFTEGIPLPWHCPERRAVLEFDDLQIPRTLKKARRSSTLRFTIDAAFPAVVRECAESYRPGQYGTWITPEFERVFTQLHELGVAHSVEAWDEDGELAGGLYGVDAGGVFCGESMFYKASNASKLCLLFLIDHLRSRGSTWLDSQVMTPHFKLLGATEISRRRFLDKLSDTQKLKLKLF
jgi:leucyl/phenylalanyl-tRNA---protein transferase